MIKKVEMMTPLLEACPSFRPKWREFLDEWEDQGEDLPLYLALADLARHVIALHESGDEAALRKTFSVVERWHLEGDSYVREAAAIGFLEDLQNENLHTTTTPKDFERLLGPESMRWWRKVYDFWDKGKLITDD